MNSKDLSPFIFSLLEIISIFKLQTPMEQEDQPDEPFVPPVTEGGPPVVAMEPE